MNRKLTNYYWR